MASASEILTETALEVGLQSSLLPNCEDGVGEDWMDEDDLDVEGGMLDADWEAARLVCGFQ